MCKVIFVSIIDTCSVVYAFHLDLRRTHSQLFGSEVAFDMRRFFAHTDQRAVVMYILGCLSLFEHAHG